MSIATKACLLAIVATGLSFFMISGSRLKPVRRPQFVPIVVDTLFGLTENERRSVYSEVLQAKAAALREANQRVKSISSANVAARCAFDDEHLAVYESVREYNYQAIMTRFRLTRRQIDAIYGEGSTNKWSPD